MEICKHAHQSIYSACCPPLLSKVGFGLLMPVTESSQQKPNSQKQVLACMPRRAHMRLRGTKGKPEQPMASKWFKSPSTYTPTPKRNDAMIPIRVLGAAERVRVAR